jgi:hypothetical protein
MTSKEMANFIGRCKSVKQHNNVEQASSRGRRPSHPPQLLFAPSTRSEDSGERLRALVEEWLVPMLVEEFLRCHKLFEPEHSSDPKKAHT